MKIILLIALIATAPALSHAQGAVVIAEDLSPQGFLRHLEAATDRANQISNGIATLQTLNSALEYQVRAFQALGEGSWEGFVEFFNYQNAAFQGFNQSIANLDSVPGMFATRVRNEDGSYSYAGNPPLSSDTYDQLKLHSNNIARSWDAANSMVIQTDILIDASERNLEAMQGGLQNIANAEGLLEALQANGQILAAMGAENRAVTQLLYTQQRLIQTFILNQADKQALDNEIARRFMESPDPSDPNSAYAENPVTTDYLRRALRGEFINGAQGWQQ